MKAIIAVVLAVAISVMAQIATVSEPALAEIHAAAATIKPEVTTSDVKGLVFDRFYQVWLENIVRDNTSHRSEETAQLTSW
jgi:acid phosphatase